MKNLLPVLVLTLAAASTSQAQDTHELATQASTNLNAENAAEFTNSSAPSWFRSPELAVWPLVESLPGTGLSAEPGSPMASPEALPASPAPKYVYGSRDDYRWQLALGISLVRFRSSLYYATGVGTNTSLTYFTSDWLGVEGNVNTAFAPTINRNEHVKYVSYGAGPKIAWRARQLEPWAHAIAGGVHILPQVAGFGQNGFGLQIGGGADYRIYPHLSARAEVDWVRTHLFGAWQNSAQANLDLVIHF
jgi:opacity protein-like surface antigen